MDIRTMLHDEFEDDASRFSSSEFASVRGGAVAGRVRRRRRVRAAGSVGLGLAVVLGVGAVAYPSVDSALHPAVAPACVPAPDEDPEWWTNGTADGDFLTGAGQRVTLRLSEERLRVAENGTGSEPLIVPLHDHLLEGTTESGETLHLEFDSGTTIDVSLTWTDDLIEMTYALDGSDEEATFGTGPANLDEFTQFDLTDPLRRYVSYAGREQDDGSRTWIWWDQAASAEALTLRVDADDSVTVTFVDGAVEEFDAGDDGFATFEWVGVTTVQVLYESSTPTVHMGEEVWADVDAELAGPEYCLPAWATPSPSATAASSMD
ncbi:hypothetical protein [Demequina sp. NBRC 110054]|uniref:hypothetical protein n=1 Tax=Demequina sp. NBRC 110054 TaxID=1570343 RepID=UPI000A071E61|nr:hypothetical protein [Demequina sp. NBRC 110054]